MIRTILLYGADEYLGRLFVGEAVAAWAVTTGPLSFSLVLGGTNAANTLALGQQYDLAVRRLDLRNPGQMAQQLDDVDVLVNAASPFADTGVALAQAAFQARCHVIDLNPEVDVFKALGQLDKAATQAGCALVRSAGPGTVASTLMVSAAIKRLKAAGLLAEGCIGAVRLGLECVPDFSRSSAASVWRALARDVTVMRAVAMPVPGLPDGVIEMRCDHVPIGMLERAFDFAVRDGTAPAGQDIRIASAANLVDTLASSVEVELEQELAGSVESYVSITSAGRIAYQIGARAFGLGAPLGSTSQARMLSRYTLDLIADAPAERHALCPHTIVLECEDVERTRIVDWRLRTPDFYLTGARAALAVTEAVAGKASAGGTFNGLWSPAQLLVDSDLAAAQPLYGKALRGCLIDRRVLA